METPECIVVDFETEAIEQRPHYPPVPVGVAIKISGAAQGQYWAWGHPTGNTCSFNAAREQLARVWDSGLPLLFHNAKFDLAVAYERLKLPQLPWQRVHDTQFLAFLADPHTPKLGLKELADDLLHIPADEQNELHGWLWEHRAELESTYGRKMQKSELGAWIAKASGGLVAPYAVGDVERTHALFQHLWPIVQREGMGEAYDRERRLMPLLMDNERQGLRVDQQGLARDVESYTSHMASAESWLRDRLGVENFDADREVAAALLRTGVVPEDQWVRTASGQLSVSKDNLLPEMFTDPQVASALGYRNRLKTCLGMFMEPWLAQAQINRGRITTNWNQTRGYAGGTRSGRPSTNNHNFLNLSKTWEGRDDGYTHPAFLGVAPLPLVRSYVLPDEGCVILHRDYDGQEMRLFADTACGKLKQQYLDNPKLKPHRVVGAEMSAVAGREIDYTKAKSLNFQGLYGGGVPALQKKLRVSYAEAKQLKNWHDQVLPDRKRVVEAIKALVNKGEPIRTIGGRIYYCEPPGEDGRSKDYKLINYRCQGDAADYTKQALVEWHEGGPRSRFMVTVYDEINVSAPSEVADEEMEWLCESMERPRFGVEIPMLTEGKRGPNWGTLEKCE